MPAHRAVGVIERLVDVRLTTDRTRPRWPKLAEVPASVARGRMVTLESDRADAAARLREATGRATVNPHARPSLLKSSATRLLALVHVRGSARVASRTPSKPASGPMGCLA